MMHSHYQFNARPLAFGDKKISPEARALIDEAIAAGRVTRVEQGVSGDPGYVYDPRWNQIVRRRPDDPEATRAKTKAAMQSGRNKVNAQRAEDARVRRADIVQLLGEGKSRQEIADQLGIHRRTVGRLIERIAREEAAAAVEEGVK